MRSDLNIVILTGAGISAESGLKTFRDNDGLWENHRVEEVATPEAFRRYPELVHRFYNARRKQLQGPEVKPNKAHQALAELEQKWRGSFTLVTQNVDDLHERAGSKNVLHMHGHLMQVNCVDCLKVYEWSRDCSTKDQCPHCHAFASLRPNIVWFGEIPYFMDDILNDLQRADLFVSIGTSGAVYPAAGFVNQVRAIGRAKSIELNKEASEGSSFFDERYYGLATEVVPQFVGQLLKSLN